MDPFPLRHGPQGGVALTHTRGSTLIHLLLAGAVAGVAALGTLQSFGDDQVRALAARARVDFAAVAEGLEAYRIDWNHFPYDGYNCSHATLGPDRYEYWYPPLDLTTPVSYVSARHFVDPFRPISANFYHWQYNHMRYTSARSTWGDLYDHLQSSEGVSSYFADVMQEWGEWRLLSVGPDRTYGPPGGANSASWPGVSGYPSCPIPYDPTNGTESTGDLVRSEIAVQGYRNIPAP